MFTFDKLKTWYSKDANEDSDEAVENVKQTLSKGGYSRKQGDSAKIQIPSYVAKAAKKPQS